MTTARKQLIVAMFMTLVSSAAFADLPVAFVKEALMPFDQSPLNYDNSPANFDNSISNYENSESNYDNSESNFDNSLSNFENGRNGTKRLIVKEAGVSKISGYYVIASSGVTNFFSPNGRRMFFSPRKGVGVFGSRDGVFYGTLANVNGELTLSLTDRGAKILMLAQ